MTTTSNNNNNNSPTAVAASEASYSGSRTILTDKNDKKDITITTAATTTTTIPNNTTLLSATATTATNNNNNDKQDEDGSTDTIKTMKLYTHLDRIERELQYDNITTYDAVTLSKYDSLHYLGNDAVQNGLNETVLSAKTNGLVDRHSSSSSTSSGCYQILDIGSGLGGPARLMGHWLSTQQQQLQQMEEEYGVDGGQSSSYCCCNIDALELQRDWHEAAQTLTLRCDLQDIVHHYCGDILLQQNDNNNNRVLPMSKQYDAIVSWLVFLHIADRNTLFQNCYNLLKPGGRMYVEDYCQRRRSTPTTDTDTTPNSNNNNGNSGNNGFTDHERKLLAQEVYVQHELPTWEEGMKKELENVGFTVINVVDKTSVWSEYVEKRHLDYVAQLDHYIKLHGIESANAMETFYRVVSELFNKNGGNLGGVAYTVEKPVT